MCRRSYLLTVVVRRKEQVSVASALLLESEETMGACLFVLQSGTRPLSSTHSRGNAVRDDEVI